jgi:Protein of unknown function (DUF1759)
MGPNYVVALKILKDQHDKPMLAVAELFATINNLPSMIRYTRSSLQQVSNVLRSTLGSLKNCSEHLTTMNSLVTFLVTSHKDSQLREKHFKDTMIDKLLAVETLISFFNKKCDYFDTTTKDSKFSQVVL